VAVGFGLSVAAPFGWRWCPSIWPWLLFHGVHGHLQRTSKTSKAHEQQPRSHQLSGLRWRRNIVGEERWKCVLPAIFS
jgi:hypothetical protein